MIKHLLTELDRAERENKKTQQEVSGPQREQLLIGSILDRNAPITVDHFGINGGEQQVDLASSPD